MNDHYIPDDRSEENGAVREETELPEIVAAPEVPNEFTTPVAEAEDSFVPAEEEVTEAAEDIPGETPASDEEIAIPSVAEDMPADEIAEPETESGEISFADQFFSESETEEFHAESFPELIPEDEVTDIILDTLAEEALETATPEEIETLINEEAPMIPAAQIPLSDSPVQEPAARTKRERPVRKTRPRRKKGDGLLSIPHMLAVVIWLLIIVAIGTSMGRFIWVCAADVLAFGRESREVSISVTADDTIESIADKLHKAGLIHIPELFLFYADITDVEEDNKITTGTFTLNTIYDYNALVNHMGPRSTNRVVIEDVLIPEGYSCRQIFALLEEKGICKASDLEAYAASGELDDYWFLENVQRGDKYCLEGYLFPDTYDFYENSTPRLALEKMLDGFQYRINQEILDQLPALNERLTAMMRKNGESEEFIAGNQLTLRDLLNVASMIEKETGSHSESHRIASVIYNRLFSWGDSPRYLGIDATVIYALDGKIDLTAEDLAVDSPYNTRNHEGLPPGPICNPGLASIQAALNPEDTGYYYYVLNPESGTHMFAKTLAEHNKNVEKYKELLKAIEEQEAEEHEE